ncbi:MAG: hypothetical protein DMF75_10160 [Acidobacteria bacterium]|nr:MAG: hypothetical protein DMF75_10160 [Acidobacteriota bacterium]PYS62790.1 MAG: hypothetical protein DMF76_08220 [Acidobacteriota bacterium]
MNYKNAVRILVVAVVILCAIAFTAFTAAAQEQNEEKKPVVSERGRDPFKHYEPVRKFKPLVTKLEPPSIQVRIERYRAQKMTAAAAHVAPPKPTTALMLNEIQVNGIFRTPRGWAAMVEATPIKLSYVVYPGESFFDGQLVAIEESRLVFRRDTVWTDGHKDKSVEVKPLRQPSSVEAMTSAKAAPTDAPASQSGAGVSVSSGGGSVAAKPGPPEKPASPEKQ